MRQTAALPVLVRPLRWGEGAVGEGNFMLPTGTVTLLLGDVEGSTRAWEADPVAMAEEIAVLNQVVDEAVGRHDGVRPVEQGEGDSFVAAFARVRDAVACALTMQRNLAGGRLAVRMSVHTGDVQRRDEGNYVGPAIDRAARIRGVAHGGQVVLSQAACDLVVDALPPGASVRDLGIHRLRDLSRPERIFQLCHPDLPGEFPPLRSLDARCHNLPVQRTSFVGRAVELAEVSRLLSGSALVTLVGSGGCGKTRLALHAGAQLVDDYPGGVWLADLAAVTDPDDVATHIGQVFALKGDPGTTAVEALAAYLTDKQALLVLDNCEHVLPAAAAVADTLLSSCPSLRILATSRQVLNVPGEVSWRVPSLPVAGHDHRDLGSAGIAGIGACEAVQLFADRAARARADFVLSERNADAVAEICRRLDGIPLGIELAAARVRVFTPAQIARGLDERFRLLTGAPRTALPRQQTLEASVDWSYRLLTDLEQAVFRRLAVFVGDFSFDAAVEVCAAGDIQAHQVLDLLSLLVDKSLIQVDDDGELARYRLLETIRYYAGGHLAAAGEEEGTRQRYRDYYLAFAEEAERQLEGLGQTDWLDRVAADYPNIRAGLAWSRDRGQAEPLARMASALYFFWGFHGPATEGEGWMQAALDLLGPTAGALRAKTLCAGAWLACLTYHAVTGLARSEEGLMLAHEAADDRLVGRLRLGVGMAQYLQGQPTDLLERAVTLARQVGDGFAMVVGLGALGMAKKVHSPPEGRPYLEEAVRVSEEWGQAISEQVWLGHLAETMRWMGDLGRSAELSEQVIDNAQRFRNYGSLASCLFNKAAALLEMGRQAEASDIADRLEGVARQGGNRLFDTYLAVIRSHRALGERDQTGALSHAHDAMASAFVALTRCEALPALIEAELAALSLDKASRDIDELVALTETSGFGYWRACALVLKARLDRLAGDPAESEVAAHRALSAAVAVEARCRIVDALEVLAGATMDLGDLQQAGRLLGAAEAIRDTTGYWRSIYERAGDLDALRSQLGADAAEAALGQGRVLCLEDAIAYARRGRGERKRPAHGWASLSPAESHVVALVREGLSNADIAKRLLCSPRTVQAHLTHIFAKLGMSSRTELAAEAARRAASTPAGS